MDAVIHDGHVQTGHRVRGGEVKGGTSNEDPERRLFWGGVCCGRRMRFGLRAPVVVVVVVVAVGWDFYVFYRIGYIFSLWDSSGENDTCA